MNDRQLADILDEGAPLSPAGAPDDAWLARHPEALALAPLFDLGRALAALLLPIRPRPAYRAELRRGLLATARRQQAQQALIFAPVPPPAVVLFDRINALADQGLEWANQSIEWAGQGFNDMSETDRRLVVVVGSALSLGVLAYVLHSRGRVAA